MNFVAQKIGKRYFANSVKSYEPIDPYREVIGNKSVKRAIPKGLSKKDAAVLLSVRRRAHHLDKGFSLCGFSFGWGFIFGLVPLLGDLFNFYLNYTLVLTKAFSIEGGLPDSIKSRMYFNALVTLCVGFVPLLGDVVASTFKCNSRNAALLEEFLINKAAGKSAAVASAIALETPVDVNVAVDLQENEIIGSRSAGSGVGANVGNKRWYGWGKDD